MMSGWRQHCPWHLHCRGRKMGTSSVPPQPLVVEESEAETFFNFYNLSSSLSIETTLTFAYANWNGPLPSLICHSTLAAFCWGFFYFMCVCIKDNMNIFSPSTAPASQLQRTWTKITFTSQAWVLGQELGLRLCNSSAVKGDKLHLFTLTKDMQSIKMNQMSSCDIFCCKCHMSARAQTDSLVSDSRGAISCI